jgi:uncharacterized protein (DUF952 family)
MATSWYEWWVRWLYHVLDARCELHHPYTPTSLAREGFVHCSFRPVAAASARLYFAADMPLAVLQIDPRGLDVRVIETPRGPMPHVHQPIPLGAIVARWTVDQLDGAPDVIDDD